MLGEEVYSIINDYLGTPVQAYNSNGKLIWERELDIYGKTRKIEGDQNLIPFLYQGQYYDHDIELAYNRFRYYNPETGNYISQDPIGLEGNNPNFYAYTHDPNSHVDIFGLSECKKINVGDSGHHVPAVRKSKGRLFEVGRSDKTRPTFHFKGADSGHDHWRLHNAERKHVGPRQGNFKGTDKELMDAYKKAYEGLDDIKVDVKSPNGTYNLGTNVTPKQGVELVENWLTTQGLF
ncbi:RHS repeat domain-containing protein [Flavobacterium columnare]|uniref:RHS repeat domain-containing protein n=1 Tax=Flavobacterium columnare TaxID=996 RepID=UPI00293BDBDB|nr:RHS repeat-associated core domain-containing protein [Flavobacterium columnare]